MCLAQSLQLCLDCVLPCCWHGAWSMQYLTSSSNNGDYQAFSCATALFSSGLRCLQPIVIDGTLFSLVARENTVFLGPSPCSNVAIRASSGQHATQLGCFITAETTTGVRQVSSKRITSGRHIVAVHAHYSNAMHLTYVNMHICVQTRVSCP
jgi:hypothetical protein